MASWHKSEYRRTPYGYSRRRYRVDWSAVALWIAILIAIAGVALFFVSVATAATIEGTSDNDTLVGTPEPDQIYGYGGRDDIRGRGSDDELRGGGSADLIIGGAGQDQIYGSTGSDTINAQDGEMDLVNCGEGANDFAQIDLRLDVVHDNCEHLGGVGP